MKAKLQEASHRGERSKAPRWKLKLGEEESQAAALWLPGASEVRNRFALFCLRFELKTAAEVADLALFAATRYRLSVNGSIVHLGPGRFHPARMEPLAISLLPFLRVGERNEILVEVNEFGTRSCEAVRAPGFFIAWGKISFSDGQDVPLATGEGAWRVRGSEAREATAPNYGWLQHATEILDGRILQAELSDEIGWRDPQAVSLPKPYGVLLEAPRHVEPQADLPFASCRLLELASDCNEAHVGMRAVAQEPVSVSGNMRERNRPFTVAYATWIHSPQQRAIELGLYWNDCYIDGKKVSVQADAELVRLRRASVDLAAGWSLLYAETAVRTDAQEIDIGLFGDEAVECSCHTAPDLEAPQGLLSTEVLLTERFESKRQGIPANAQDLKRFPFPWRAVRQSEAEMPSRDCNFDRAIGGAPCQLKQGKTIELKGGGSAALVFQAEGAFLGHPFLVVDAPAGTVIDFVNEEVLREDGLLPINRHPFTDTADRFICRGGRQRIESFHQRGGRYLEVALRNRSHQPISATVLDAGYRDASLIRPRHDAFSCDDDLFNKVEAMSRETLRVCTTDTYIPDIWRERGMAIADNRLQTWIQRMYEADGRVSAKSVESFAFMQEADGQISAYAPSVFMGPLSDFTVTWVMWLRDHWALHGDLELVERHFEAVERVLHGSAWQSNDAGLWSSEGHKLFIDRGESREAKLGGQACATLNALRYEALKRASELAQELGLRSKAGQYEEESERVGSALRRLLWDGRRKRFASHLEGGKPSATESVHANVLALYTGLASEEQEEQIWQWLEPRLLANAETLLAPEKAAGSHLELFFLCYALQALYARDKAATAEEVIRRHWSAIIAEGSPTSWEHLRKGKGSSRCHLWSSHPIIFFIREILGIQPQVPGDESRFFIRPCADSIDRAEGAYPLKAGGEVRVSWVVEGRRLLASVSASEGIAWRVAPRGRLAELDLEVQPLEAAGPRAG